MARDKSDQRLLTQKLTDYRTSVIAGVVVLAGVAILWMSAGLDWFEAHSTSKSVADQLGGILVTTGGLAILWDLRGRRDIVDEVLAKVDLSGDIQTTGIQRASMDWRVVPWTDLIANAKHIDILIAYGSTWLSTYSTDLAEFAKDPNKKLRYFLPDPTDETAMEVLAHRFDYTTETIKSKIMEAARTIAKISQNGNADIRVWFRGGASTFTCYRFDDTVVVTLYSHQLARGAIPTLVMNKGTFADFFKEDLQAIENQGREVGRNELLGDDGNG